MIQGKFQTCLTLPLNVDSSLVGRRAYWDSSRVVVVVYQLFFHVECHQYLTRLLTTSYVFVDSNNNIVRSSNPCSVAIQESLIDQFSLLTTSSVQPYSMTPFFILK